MLSGGDYDGDTGTIFWDEILVSLFDSIDDADAERFLNPPYPDSQYWKSFSVEIETEDIDNVEQLEFALQRYEAKARDELLSDFM